MIVRKSRAGSLLTVHTMACYRASINARDLELDLLAEAGGGLGGFGWRRLGRHGAVFAVEDVGEESGRWDMGRVRLDGVFEGL